jgi:hypothetical protein
MRGLKDLNSENMTLKRLVSELNLERWVLKCFPRFEDGMSFVSSSLLSA